MKVFFRIVLVFVLVNAIGAFWFKWPVDWSSQNVDRTFQSGTLLIASGAADSITSTTPWSSIHLWVGATAAASSLVVFYFKTDLGATLVDSLSIRTYADKNLGNVAYSGPLPPDVEHIKVTSTGAGVRVAWAGLKEDKENNE